ncbi:MAG: hypothetical protein QNJ16_20700 [Rhodobacter sp.]|nr:hypothetical protein [Rhodobacter sp.]
MTLDLPPNPRGFQNLQEWASQLYEWQLAQTRIDEFAAPEPIALAHKISDERAAQDGVLMYDPVAKNLVLAHTGIWNAITGGGGGAEVNDLTAAVTWTNIPDANVPQSAVTQHQAALSITESQISDLISVVSQVEAEAGTATTARRWTAERVKQAIDALAPGGSSVYGFRKRSSTDTSNAAPTLIIPWQTDEGSLGTDITWDSGNNTRLTIATTGTYRIGGFVTFSTTQQRGQATVEILINGVSEGIYRGGSYVRNSGTSWDFWCIEVASEPFNLTATDYVEFRLARNSGAGASYTTGGSGTIVHSGTRSRIWAERVA